MLSSNVSQCPCQLDSQFQCQQTEQSERQHYKHERQDESCDQESSVT